MAEAKLEIGDENDAKCATFIMRDEDHTLGNAVHYALMKNPSIAFSGYSVPHPSEPKVNVRVQTTGISASEALRQGLSDLKSICNHILETFDEEVAEDIHSTSKINTNIPKLPNLPAPKKNKDKEKEKEKEKEKKKESKKTKDVEMEDADEEEEEEEEDLKPKSKSKGKEKKSSKSRYDLLG